MGTRIVSNLHPRPLVPWNDLPEPARNFFDYVEEDERWSDRFVEYRGSWYDIGDVQQINVAPTFCAFGVNVQPDSPLTQWDGVQSDTYWTGTVFRFLRGELRDIYAPDEDGYVQVGRYIEEGWTPRDGWAVRIDSQM